jgi:hypothetical protein
MFAVELTIALIIAGFIGWWLLKPSKLNTEPAKPIPAIQKYDGYQDELESKPFDELDADEQEVRKAFEVFEQHEKERFDCYVQKKTSIQEDEKKLKKAREFVETSRLSVALPYVYEETKHWSSWSALPEGRSWNPPLPVENVEGSSSSIQESWTQFRAHGFLFRIDFEESRFSIDDDSQVAELRLTVDGIEVLGMGVARDWAKEYDNWHFATVNCLRVGPWMSKFVDLYGQLLAIEEGMMEDVSNEYVTERAAKIDLGQGG